MRTLDVQITMAKLEGAKTVVVGGKKTVPQQYCGTVGGESTDFTTMDSLVKTAQLKNNSLAPPDFITNSVQGITFRLGFGVIQKDEPEGKFLPLLMLSSDVVDSHSGWLDIQSGRTTRRTSIFL